LYDYNSDYFLHWFIIEMEGQCVFLQEGYEILDAVLINFFRILITFGWWALSFGTFGRKVVHLKNFRISFFIHSDMIAV